MVAVAYADEVTNKLKFMDPDFDDLDLESESERSESIKSNEDSSVDDGDNWLDAEKEEELVKEKNPKEDNVGFQRACAKLKQLQLIRVRYVFLFI